MGDKVGRDSEYRRIALEQAVIRAGHDGGITGTEIDVIAKATTYYQWLTGKTDLKDPVLEEVKKEKK